MRIIACVIAEFAILCGYGYRKNSENSVQHRRIEAGLQRQRACLLHTKGRAIPLAFSRLGCGCRVDFYDFYAFEIVDSRRICNGGSLLRTDCNRIYGFRNLPRGDGYEDEIVVAYTRLPRRKSQRHRMRHGDLPFV